MMARHQVGPPASCNLCSKAETLDLAGLTLLGTSTVLSPQFLRCIHGLAAGKRYCMNAAALFFVPKGERLPAESQPIKMQQGQAA